MSGYGQSLQCIIPTQYCTSSTGWFRLVPKVNLSWGSSINSGSDGGAVVPYVNFSMSSNNGLQTIRMITTTALSSATAYISYKFSGIVPSSYSTTAGAPVTDVTTYPLYNDSPTFNNLSMVGTAKATALTVSGASLLAATTASGLLTSQNVVYCNNQTNTKMICLYDNDYAPSNVNGTNFNGFGIQSGAMRYQVPTGSAHRFFGGTVEMANFSSNGLAITGGLGLVLPTTGGTPSTLSYYEEYAYSTAITGPYSIANVNFSITRIGRVVTLTMTSLSTSAASTNSSAAFANATNLPTRFCPVSSTSFPIEIYDTTNNPAVTWIARLVILSSGGFNISLSPSGGFNSGSTYGIVSFSVSYSIS